MLNVCENNGIWRIAGVKTEERERIEALREESGTEALHSWQNS